MNSTSFTSIESDCAGNNDKVAIIDNSSTANLTLNASINRPPRSTHGSINSDSDPDRSPSVTVLTTTSGNDLLHNQHHHHHHLHHHPLSRPSQLITGGFSLSNRLHLTKHKRSLCSRSTQFEKLLMIAVAVLGMTTILLIISLISLYLSQKNHFELEHEHNKTTSGDKQQESIEHPSQKQREQQQQEQLNRECSKAAMISNNTAQNKNYCLTPDCVKVAASVIEAIDLTVDPCDDFYVSFASNKLSFCVGRLLNVLRVPYNSHSPDS